LTLSKEITPSITRYITPGHPAIAHGWFCTQPVSGHGILTVGGQEKFLLVVRKSADDCP